MDNIDKWKVIVVEDTYDDQQLVSRILTHHGIEVIVVQDGNECLEMLHQVQPTAIITDLAMPNKDGWQTLVAIRSDINTAHIPVIAITAYHSADVAEDAMRAGFDGYFPKPISPQTFVGRMREIVGD
ncbi:MAG: response regulator [Anaerolineaceae bacterium]|nr:MAG: response regulator [Anaerolineaceae bacterium]